MPTIMNRKRVSRVLFGGSHLSQRPRALAASSPTRLLSSSGLGEPPSLSANSEIATGRIPLFSPGHPLARWARQWSLLLSPPHGCPAGGACVGLSRSGRTADLSPAFTGHPAVCSPDFPLPPKDDSDHPAHTAASSPLHAHAYYRR